MDKQAKLLLNAERFLALAVSAAEADTSLAGLVFELKNIVSNIRQGTISSPWKGYHPKFHGEDLHYGAGTTLYSAESDFISFLEDWPSQPGYPKDFSGSE